MPLTESRLRTLRRKDRSYKVADQRGLYIEVTPSGSKLWRFRYRIGKVEKKLSIGRYPEISLRRARDLACEARQLVASGGDPALQKRMIKIRKNHLAAQTFKVIAIELIEQMMTKQGLAQAAIDKANACLENLAPAIGNRPIHAIEPFEVFGPLARLQASGRHEVARECLAFARSVFRYGVSTARCAADPTLMLKGLIMRS